MRSAPKRAGSCVSSSTSAGGGETSMAPFLRRLGRAGLVCPTALGVAFTHQTGPQEDRVLTVDKRSIPLMLNIVNPMWANFAGQPATPVGTNSRAYPWDSSDRPRGIHRLQPMGDVGAVSPRLASIRSAAPRRHRQSGRAHRLRSPLRSRHRRGGRPHRPVAAASPSGPPACQTTGD
jgi:hypothetical protein